MLDYFLEKFKSKKEGMGKKAGKAIAEKMKSNDRIQKKLPTYKNLKGVEKNPEEKVKMKLKKMKKMEKKPKKKYEPGSLNRGYTKYASKTSGSNKA